jgi:hypothetical protein
MIKIVPFKLSGTSSKNSTFLEFVHSSSQPTFSETARRGRICRLNEYCLLPHKQLFDRYPPKCPQCNVFMERRFRSGQQCILYHTDFVAKVVIADQVCGVCDTKRSYDGMTDGVINVDNHYLFTHELIVEYLDGYFFSGTPLASFFASKLSLWKRKSWGWSGESEHIAHVDCAYLEKNCDFQKFKVWIAILIP